MQTAGGGGRESKRRVRKREGRSAAGEQGEAVRLYLGFYPNSFFFFFLPFQNRSPLSKQRKVDTDVQFHLDNQNLGSVNVGSGVFTYL